MKTWRRYSGMTMATENKLHYRPLMNLRDCEGDSLLHVACREGKLEVAVALLDAGADVDEKNEAEDTALHLAVTFGHLKWFNLYYNLGGRIIRTKIDQPK